MTVSEEELRWRRSGTLHGTWKALGVVPPARGNHPKLNPRTAAQIDHARIREDFDRLRTNGALPVLPAGHEYIVRLDGVYTRVLRPEGMV